MYNLVQSSFICYKLNYVFSSCWLNWWVKLIWRPPNYSVRQQFLTPSSEKLSGTPYSLHTWFEISFLVLAPLQLSASKKICVDKLNDLITYWNFKILYFGVKVFQENQKIKKSLTNSINQLLTNTNIFFTWIIT